MIGNVGLVCSPVCLVPVWPGIMAPSGVLMVGLALVLRDVLQQRLGALVTVYAVCLGAILSAVVTTPHLAAASAAAFAVSELSDTATFTILRRQFILAAPSWIRWCSCRWRSVVWNSSPAR